MTWSHLSSTRLVPPLLPASSSSQPRQHHTSQTEPERSACWRLGAPAGDSRPRTPDPSPLRASPALKLPSAPHPHQPQGACRKQETPAVACQGWGLHLQPLEEGGREGAGPSLGSGFPHRVPKLCPALCREHVPVVPRKTPGAVGKGNKIGKLGFCPKAQLANPLPESAGIP